MLRLQTYIKIYTTCAVTLTLIIILKTIIYIVMRIRLPGLFKDECGGKVISEFVSLRSKLYHVLIDDDKNPSKKAAEGVKKKIASKYLLHDDYKNVLFGGEEVNVSQTTFRSVNHTMYSVRQNKCALSAIDSKRYILPDLVSTRALGHYLNKFELNFDISSQGSDL